MRHVNIRNQLIVFYVQEGELIVEHINTADNPADHLTKALQGEPLFKHRRTRWGAVNDAIASVSVDPVAEATSCQGQ